MTQLRYRYDTPNKVFVHLRLSYIITKHGRYTQWAIKYFYNVIEVNN